MKKLVSLFGLIILVQAALAGGILTNSNQSTLFARMLSRGASTQLDAVYYNPAGLMKLDNGLYGAFYNQSLFQTRTLTTSALVSNQEFIGDARTSLFPNAYAIYKTNGLAFSLGVGPVGGGGSILYENGLPVFEKYLANFANSLAPLQSAFYDIQGYEADMEFRGSSVFWGLQAGISARINDMLSVYLGVRYIPATKSYEGGINNIKLNVDGVILEASPFLSTVSGQMADRAILAETASNGLLPIIGDGAGSLTLEGATNIHYYINAENRGLLEGGLIEAGYTATQINAMTISEIQSIYAEAARNMAELSTFLQGASAMAQGINVDTQAEGRGLLPFVVGFNISPAENINIGIKYEHKASLIMVNETTGDDLGFDFLKDGKEIKTDIPGLISIGVDYNISDKLLASFSFCNYFDKSIDWGFNIYGEERKIDQNSWDLAVGFQYNVKDNFALSIGGMKSNSGVSDAFQSELEFSNSAITGACGFQWKVNENFVLDAGVFSSFYSQAIKSISGYQDTYDKSTFGFSVGAGFKIF